MAEKIKRVRINRSIRAETVRVIGPDSQQIGIMPINRALYIAQDLGLDLVEVAPQANPPVCRIIDYGKYKYEQQKRERTQKKKHRSLEMKEMVFRPSIDKHDFDVKVKHLKKFLISGHKTRIIVRFRRAELAHKERGILLLSNIEKELEEVGKVVKPPHMMGRNFAMIIAPTAQPAMEGLVDSPTSAHLPDGQEGQAGVRKNAQTKDKEVSS